MNMRRKGHLPFVRAAARLPGVEFVLVGAWEGAAAQELRELAGPNVTLTGWLADEELDRWFRRAAVYVQASLHEGFGLSLAEAMLAGCVPVVSDAGALPEVVGDTGVTIPEPSEEAVAAGVRRGLELGEPEGERARARILERFPPAERGSAWRSRRRHGASAAAERPRHCAPREPGTRRQLALYTRPKWSGSAIQSCGSGSSRSAPTRS